MNRSAAVASVALRSLRQFCRHRTIVLAACLSVERETPPTTASTSPGEALYPMRSRAVSSRCAFCHSHGSLSQAHSPQLTAARATSWRDHTSTACSNVAQHLWAVCTGHAAAAQDTWKLSDVHVVQVSACLPESPTQRRAPAGSK